MKFYNSYIKTAQYYIHKSGNMSNRYIYLKKRNANKTNSV